MKDFKADTAWVVEMTDFEWFSIDDDGRAALIAKARTNGREAGCDSIAIFAIPDPIFPVYGITVKKRVHNEQLATGKAWGISCVHVIDLVPAIWAELDEPGRLKLLKNIREVVNIKGRTNPGRYEIVLPNGDGSLTYVERGKV